ncbi:MAG TPA: GNAT family N-acetyltransferase [Intrasporangium sp.]|uniref:GNAT family N-acetyltransferase n=1 Tax=Intrasporangium sp. TaxID=1925024 RepID=UPI002B4A5A3F|nr:GNAT family N-acetyltransferase [Intrasporangium sp.]HKX68104.1 GNAT family N-acetyltransferase [Intrasporangium sp.]
MTTMGARSGRTGDTQGSRDDGLTIRQATGNDLDDVIEIGHRTWPVIYEPIAGIDYVAMGLAKWWTSDVVAASIRRGQTLVAELAGDVIGMVAFGTQNGDFVVWKLYVLPEHHGKGIGSRLMDAVVDRALEGGHTRITVAYPAGNGYAERFHRAHGFVESHREPSGSGLPDTIWMVRELGSSDGAAGESDGAAGASDGAAGVSDGAAGVSDGAAGEST